MTNQTNDGGPAFPLTSSTGDPRDGVYCANGMTLRDYFAAKALSSMAGKWRFFDRAQKVATDLSKANKKPEEKVEVQDVVAAWSYEFADAMLKARNQ